MKITCLRILRDIKTDVKICYSAGRCKEEVGIIFKGGFYRSLAVAGSELFLINPNQA